MPAHMRHILLMTSLLIAGSIAIQTAEAAAPKLEVEACQWGFDDLAVPRAFNVLTVVIRNNADEPFDGKLRARRLLGTAGTWTDAELVEPLYVGPLTAKIVHLYPYVLEDSGTWELRWGEALTDAYVTELPPLSPGARVLFNDARDVSGITRGLKGCRDDFFPPSVVGTETLRLAVLDHPPNWEDARRKAFRDWLFRGGVLHVLHGKDGRYPRLPINELNVDPRPHEFGAGRVYWHPVFRGQLDRDLVYNTILPTSPEITPLTSEDGDSFDIDPTDEKFFKNRERFFYSASEWNTDRLIPQRQKELVRPRHNWFLLYSLSAVYVLLIFPGGMLLSRSRFDYRLSLLSLLAVVATFSGLFAVIGAKAYGEASASIVSAALISPLPDDRWDVEQWNSLFVTSGGRYGLTAQSEFFACTTAQENEKVDGWIDNGSNGHFNAVMPPFTFRSILSRMQFRAAPCDAKLVTSESEDSIDAVINGRLPSSVERAWLVIDDQIFETAEPSDFRTDRLTFQFKGTPKPVPQVLNLGSHFKNLRWEETLDITQGLRRFDLWLITRDLKIRRSPDIFQTHVLKGRARLYVAGVMPPETACRNADGTGAATGQQQGRAVYCFDLPLPAGYQLPVSAEGS